MIDAEWYESGASSVAKQMKFLKLYFCCCFDLKCYCWRLFDHLNGLPGSVPWMAQCKKGNCLMVYFLHSWRTLTIYRSVNNIVSILFWTRSSHIIVLLLLLLLLLLVIHSIHIAVHSVLHITFFLSLPSVHA